MGRSPYGGRNWEGFSPDPYLTGVAMKQSVKEIQDAGVQATAKHWLFNEQEILRNPVRYPNGTVQYESVSSNVDDRTTRKWIHHFSSQLSFILFGMSAWCLFKIDSLTLCI